MSLAIDVPSVGICGFNSKLSNKVLWLVDGQIIYWDFLATPLLLNIPVAMEEIERIEIIRGPGAAIYGANTVSGIISIITCSPGEGPAALVSFSGDWPNYIHATALASCRVEEIGYRLSAGYDQEGCWAKEGGYTDNGSQVAFQENQNLGAQELQANGRLDYSFLKKGFA